MTLKNQFIPAQPSKGNRFSMQQPEAPEQASAPEPANKSGEGSVSQNSPRKKGSGLLSNYLSSTDHPVQPPHIDAQTVNKGSQMTPAAYPAIDPLAQRILPRSSQSAPRPTPGPQGFAGLQQPGPQPVMRSAKTPGPVQYPGSRPAEGYAGHAPSGQPVVGSRPPEPLNNVFKPGPSPYNAPPAFLRPAQPSSYARPMSSESHSGQKAFPIWARAVMGFMILLILAGGGGIIYYEVEIAPSVNNILGHSAIHNNTAKNSQAGATTSKGTPITGNNSVLSGQNRINILLLGSDTDGKNSAPLAQTDIVVTIDQKTHYVGMLSIPRDLQVYIPNNGDGKMDAAFSYGWQSVNSTDRATLISAGAGLAEDTIAANFGIHIDHYAWVGLDGFVNVINTAGGVDVDVTHPMVDDNYPDDVNNGSNTAYAYKRLYIAPGPQHLNGEEALDYVRTRHSDLQGDFGRSARQQQVISALKTKLATPDVIGQAQTLLSDLNGSLVTDIQNLSDVVYLANLARNVDPNQVDRVTLSPPYSSPSTANTNYLPNCPAIEQKISQMFAIQGNCIAQTADGGTAGLASVSEPQAGYHALATANTDVDTSSTNIVTPSTRSITVQPLAAQSAFDNINWNIDMPTADLASGIHSMLDWVFLTTFESFDAIEV